MTKTKRKLQTPVRSTRLVRSGDTITFRYYGKEYTRKVLKVIHHEPEYLVESCPPHQIKIQHADLVAPNDQAHT